MFNANTIQHALLKLTGKKPHEDSQTYMNMEDLVSQPETFNAIKQRKWNVISLFLHSGNVETYTFRKAL